MIERTVLSCCGINNYGVPGSSRTLVRHKFLGDFRYRSRHSIIRRHHRTVSKSGVAVECFGLIDRSVSDRRVQILLDGVVLRTEHVTGGPLTSPFRIPEVRRERDRDQRTPDSLPGRADDLCVLLRRTRLEPQSGPGDELQ